MKYCPCQKGTEAFSSCRKQNSAVSAKPCTSEFHTLACVEEQRPLCPCTCCCSEHSTAWWQVGRGRGFARRTLPTAPSALKEPNPHTHRENLQLLEPAMLRHGSCQPRGQEVGKSRRFLQAFVRDLYLSPAVWLWESVQGLHATCT